MLGQNFVTSVVSYLNFVPLECSIVTFHAHGIVQEYLVIPSWHCLGFIIILSLLILYSNLCCNLLISTTMLPDERCEKASSMHVYIFHRSYYCFSHYISITVISWSITTLHLIRTRSVSLSRKRPISDIPAKGLIRV